MAHHGTSIAAFVSPHGYGHAARACAVMEAFAQLDRAVTFEVFTLVPEWFFADSLSCRFGYHPLLTDVGLAQTTPIAEDLDETLRRLARFLSFGDAALDALAAELHRLGCRLVLADISPLGLAAARRWTPGPARSTIESACGGEPAAVRNGDVTHPDLRIAWPRSAWGRRKREHPG